MTAFIFSEVAWRCFGPCPSVCYVELHTCCNDSYVLYFSTAIHPRSPSLAHAFSSSPTSTFFVFFSGADVCDVCNWQPWIFERIVLFLSKSFWILCNCLATKARCTNNGCRDMSDTWTLWSPLVGSILGRWTFADSEPRPSGELLCSRGDSWSFLSFFSFFTIFIPLLYHFLGFATALEDMIQIFEICHYILEHIKLKKNCYEYQAVIHGKKTILVQNYCLLQKNYIFFPYIFQLSVIPLSSYIFSN